MEEEEYAMGWATLGLICLHQLSCLANCEQVQDCLHDKLEAVAVQTWGWGRWSMPSLNMPPLSWILQGLALPSPSTRASRGHKGARRYG